MKSLFKSIIGNFTNKVNIYLVENIFGLISAEKMKLIMGEVNNMFAELFAKTPVKFAKYLITTNQTLSSLVADAVIDGLTLNENDVICLSGQVNSTENGLWLIRVVSVPIRPDNYLNAESQHGALVLILNLTGGIVDRLWISIVNGMNITLTAFAPGAASSEKLFYTFEATEGQTTFTVPPEIFTATDFYIPLIDWVPQNPAILTRIGNEFTYASGLALGQTLTILKQ